MVFGSQLDIHTGGVDLAFPHHENEIAQSEVFHQCNQWGSYFLHSGRYGCQGAGGTPVPSEPAAEGSLLLLQGVGQVRCRTWCCRLAFQTLPQL